MNRLVLHAVIILLGPTPLYNPLHAGDLEHPAVRWTTCWFPTTD
jgi:hypothetical protein